MLRDQCLLRVAAPAPAANVKCLWTSVISAAWHGNPHETPAARQDFKPLLAIGSGLQPLRSTLPAQAGSRAAKGQGTAELSSCQNSPEVRLASPPDCRAPLPAQITALAIADGSRLCCAARRGVTRHMYGHPRTPNSTRGYLAPNCRAGKRAGTVRLCIRALHLCLLMFLWGCLQTGFGWLVWITQIPFLIGMITGRTVRLN